MYTGVRLTWVTETSPHPGGTGRDAERGRTVSTALPTCSSRPSAHAVLKGTTQHRDEPGPYGRHGRKSYIHNWKSFSLAWDPLPNYLPFAGGLPCSFNFPLRHGSKQRLRTGETRVEFGSHEFGSRTQCFETYLSQLEQLRDFTLRAKFLVFHEDLGAMGTLGPHSWTGREEGGWQRERGLGALPKPLPAPPLLRLISNLFVHRKRNIARCPYLYRKHKMERQTQKTLCFGTGERTWPWRSKDLSLLSI